ncbi:hypothetical protein [Sporosarcina sp. FSL K6-1508]|uniref:hypothetical protein n=1 Tax=Sporosarcina sp. FSL K6-1508 TaxID=2921553 RepID=UPI0030F9B604
MAVFVLLKKKLKLILKLVLHLKRSGVILDNVASPTYRKQSNNEKEIEISC